MKRNKKNSDFFSKKRSKYKLTFFNESSLEDVWTICFSRFGAIMTAILLIGLIVVAILSVIVGTPVKNLLPGYLKTEERIEMVDKILRVDSLAAEVQRRDAYIKNLASILTGEIKIDSIGQQCEQRRKEIAIRKVNGATVWSILFLFFREYLIMLCIAALFAFPITYVIIKQWILNYVRQVSISPLPFILILIGLALTVIAGISWRVWKAANENPAEVIKNE